ncbi:MAG: hypothetical protein ACRCYX_02200 [Dermatophilaceae bacterium]
MFSRVKLFCVATAAFAVAGLAYAVPASAVGGDCTSWHNEQAVNNSPNKYRVGATCRSLQSDSKTRGVLVADNQGDGFTTWFTRTNISYYSDWKTLWSWDFSGTKVEIVRR